MTKFLDNNGLTHFWEKIKATFAKKTDIPTAVSELTNDEGFVTTDANVTQTAIDNTSTDEYRVLLSNNANDTTETAGVNKNTNLKFKPNGGQLTVPILKVLGSASANGEMSASNIKALATIGGRVFVGVYGENSTKTLLIIDPDDGTITLSNDLINVIKEIKVTSASSADSATKASKLGTSTVGGADQIVYLKDGVPTAGTSASTSATANTIAKRQGNGYLYATYYNASNGAENPASYTAYPVFKDSNGWFRMSTLANFKNWFGKANSASSADTATKATYAALTNAGSTTGTTAKNFTIPAAATEIIVTGQFSSKILSASIPKAILTTSNQEVWLTGGRGASSGSSFDGALRCLCHLKLSSTTLTLQGVSANDQNVDRTSAVTWHVFYR